MNAATKSQLVLWATGLGVLALIVSFVIVVFQMRGIDAQYTQPGIADYQNGNYPKAIQELNTSIKLNSGDSHAYYYLGLSLKKMGKLPRARWALLGARSIERGYKHSSPDFVARCDRAINDIDDGH